MSNLLKDYPVIIEFPVAWGEMDSMGHVNNIVYFRYFESARIAYFEKMDLMGYMAETGIGPILGEISCKFKIPLSYPDKVLMGVKVVSIEEDRCGQRPDSSVFYVLRNIKRIGNLLDRAWGSYS